ncbi:MAG: hypothetical protein QF654_07675 [Alphaproteobacteria bacterium]|jgi:hypothetical protein|nr:hypothetical protein [Alphaproteobacteria bacterium]
MIELVAVVVLAFAVLIWVVYKMLTPGRGGGGPIFGGRAGKLLWIFGGGGALLIVILLILAFLDVAR